MDLDIARTTEDLAKLEKAKETIAAQFSNQLKMDIAQGELTIEAGPENLLELCKFLKDSKELDFSYMRCLLGQDLRDCLEVIYLLYSISKGLKITLRTKLKRDNPRVPSVYSVWKSADWHEREAAEMLGIIFEGHPNPKTLLLKEDFQGHPLRKDFELKSGGSEQSQSETSTRNMNHSDEKPDPNSSQMSFDVFKGN